MMDEKFTPVWSVLYISRMKLDSFKWYHSVKYYWIIHSLGFQYFNLDTRKLDSQLSRVWNGAIRATPISTHMK